MGYISILGKYYEGDRQVRGIDENDQLIYDPEAPLRPSEQYIWDMELQGWKEIPDPESVAKQLENIFLAQGTAIRSQYYSIKPAIRDAIFNNDYESAGFMINNLSIPVELEGIKDELLSVLKVQAEKFSFIPPDFKASETQTPTTDPSDWWTNLKTALQNFFGGNHG